MTYLNLVNNVLRRLREDTVSSYTDSDYSTMIGDYVNDAMHLVQNAHNWSQLMTELSLSTVASQQTLELEGLGEGGQIYQILNDTQNHKLQARDAGWMKIQTHIASAPEGPPMFWAFNSQASDGDMVVDFYPIPDDAYTMKIYCKKMQADMSADGTTLLVPAQPVIQYALAFALEERGDSGGHNNMTQLQRAELALADAVGLDLQRHPELSNWVAV